MREKLAVCPLVCVLATVAKAQDSFPGGSVERDAASKVLALEKLWNTAEVRGDLKALDLIFDDSMMYVDEDGSLLSKAQFLARVAKEAGTNVQWLVTPNLTARVYGNTAVVVGSYIYKDAKAHPHQGRFIDTWVLKKNGWSCVVAQSTPILR